MGNGEREHYNKKKECNGTEFLRFIIIIKTNY